MASGDPPPPSSSAAAEPPPKRLRAASHDDIRQLDAAISRAQARVSIEQTLADTRMQLVRLDELCTLEPDNAGELQALRAPLVQTIAELERAIAAAGAAAAGIVDTTTDEDDSDDDLDDLDDLDDDDDDDDDLDDDGERRRGVVGRIAPNRRGGYIVEDDDGSAGTSATAAECSGEGGGVWFHMHDVIFERGGFEWVCRGLEVSFRHGVDANGCACALDVRAVNGSPLPTNIVSGAASWTGRKPTQEDRYVNGHSMPHALGRWFAVIDGHGGPACADFAAARLHGHVAAAYQTSGAKGELVASALTSGFLKADAVYLQQATRRGAQDGATALAALVRSPIEMYVANLGDSRAVMGQVTRGRTQVAARCITTDHKPGLARERERAEYAGGLVASIAGIWRVTTAVSAPSAGRAGLLSMMSFGGVRDRVWLAVSRALGDLPLKEPKPVVSAEPEIHKVDVDPSKDAFLVLACDGVWDVLDNEQVVQIVARRLFGSVDDVAPASEANASAPKSMEELAAEDVVRTSYQEGSGDNLTCVVMRFAWFDSKTWTMRDGYSDGVTVAAAAADAGNADAGNAGAAEDGASKPPN
ncbi:protein phosphatase [Pycnococcus provasolii]